jgi:hypothetical protein
MGENRKAVNAILRKNAERIERAKAQSITCPGCKTRVEQWWSYCAMCGWHIAATGADEVQS